MLYFWHETQKRSLAPMVQWTKATSNLMQQIEPFSITPIPKLIKASCELTYQLIKDYPKNAFNIHSVVAKDNNEYQIEEKNIIEKPFCSLKHFKKIRAPEQKSLLIVAPLSGHYATLLKDTVKSCLKDFDVYITDWNNARDIPLSQGIFGFEDYMLYCEDFIKYFKSDNKELHVLAVCQPTVPVLGVVAYLQKHDTKNSPDSIVLMGGPIDTRKTPTAVNEYAMRYDINWFKSHVIDFVPFYFKGVGRKVYPGFLQHAGFLAMNLKKHNQAHIDFFNHLVEGADLNAQKHREFYEEYNSVLDLDAAYYIETLENVFMDQKLAKGTLKYKNQTVCLNDLHDIKCLSIEGELDDISGAGQTHVVYDLTTNLSKDKKIKYTAPEVGHYGLFSGRRWRQEIYPRIANYLLNNKFDK